MVYDRIGQVLSMHDGLFIPGDRKHNVVNTRFSFSFKYNEIHSFRITV